MKTDQPAVASSPDRADNEQRARNLLRELALPENEGRVRMIADALGIWFPASVKSDRAEELAREIAEALEMARNHCLISGKGEGDALYDKLTSASRLLRTHMGAERKDETAWLLEHEINGVTHYACVDGFMLGWTTDPNEALRLARRHDGDKLAEIMEDADYVREHMWPSAPDAEEKA